MAGNQAEGKGCQAEGTASERLRGKQGPGRLEDRGQEAGVAEAERPRMKHEAAMEAGTRGRGAVSGFAALRCRARVFGGQRRNLIDRRADEPGGRPTQPSLYSQSRKALSDQPDSSRAFWAL